MCCIALALFLSCLSCPLAPPLASCHSPLFLHSLLPSLHVAMAGLPLLLYSLLLSAFLCLYCPLNSPPHALNKFYSILKKQKQNKPPKPNTIFIYLYKLNRKTLGLGRVSMVEKAASMFKALCNPQHAKETPLDLERCVISCLVFFF